jgi:hypothetical protein
VHNSQQARTTEVAAAAKKPNGDGDEKDKDTTEEGKAVDGTRSKREVRKKWQKGTGQQ